MSVINLPINATEDRVIGTVDIEKAIVEGLKALEPGILADAHRNILYIDEVNLLSDNVADVLLDAAAMGINIIEREGISIHHPANFILVGTMNPEEGNLRPQLLDRFGLSVDVERILDVKKRVKIMKYSEQYHKDPQQFHDQFEAKQKALRDRILKGRNLLPAVKISEKLLEKIAEVCIAFETDGHRADITINLAAKTIAAFEERTQVQLKDIELASRLALPHRLRRLPFQDEEMDEDKLKKILYENKPKNEENQPPREQKEKQEGKEEEKERKKIEKSSNNTQNERHKNNQNEENKGDRSKNQDKNNSMKEAQKNPEIRGELDRDRKKNEQFKSKKEKKVHSIRKGVRLHDITSKKKKLNKIMNSNGNLVSHPTYDKKGKYVKPIKKSRLNIPTHSDVAILPTINDAAVNSKGSALKNHNKSPEKKIQINSENIKYKSREGKSSYLVIFCLDASGSMGVQRRMELVKGAIFSILKNNYVNRDKVSLVVFREKNAEVVLPPTKSTDLAYKMLKEIPTGGTTPLVYGISKAIELADEEIQKDTGYIPQIILISDARGNVYHKDAIKDLEKVGLHIAEKKIETIVIDTEIDRVKLELSEIFAKFAQASYYHLDELTKTDFNQVLRKEGLIPLSE